MKEWQPFYAEGDWHYGMIAPCDAHVHDVVLAFWNELGGDESWITDDDMNDLVQALDFVPLRNVLKGDLEDGGIEDCEWHTAASGARRRPTWWIGPSFRDQFDMIEASQ